MFGAACFDARSVVGCWLLVVVGCWVLRYVGWLSRWRR
jgi:hypothetical protein